MDILKILNRDNPLFVEDLLYHKNEINEIVANSSFLVLGGAGSIGRSVSLEIYRRFPKRLHIVDISENNLVELVRDLRSSFENSRSEFKTFCIDISSNLYDSFIKQDGVYDYVLNLSALKHVRSERDSFTLARLIQVNILNTIKTLQQSRMSGVKKYFCVSSDKAANPVNMMGASKRIMELFLEKESENILVSTARFANVAFSDGSLLFGFLQRIQKRQPIVAPSDVSRFFITPQEAGELCLMSCLFGSNRDVYFPKLNKQLCLVNFTDIAKRFLNELGYEAFECESELQARKLIDILPKEGKWPCFFSISDTTGEKTFEEFYTANEKLDLDLYKSIGVIKNEPNINSSALILFLSEIENLFKGETWNKEELVLLFKNLLPEFTHFEKGKNLDQKM